MILQLQQEVQDLKQILVANFRNTSPESYDDTTNNK